MWYTEKSRTVLIFGGADGMNADLRVAIDNARNKASENLETARAELKAAKNELQDAKKLGFFGRRHMWFKKEFIMNGPIDTLKNRVYARGEVYWEIKNDLDRLEEFHKMLTKLWPDGVHLSSRDAALIVKYN